MRAEWTNLRRRQKPKALFGNLIAAMRERLLTEPGDLRLRESLAFHLGRAGRYDEAVAEAEILVRSTPESLGARRLLVSLKLNRLLRRARARSRH